MERSVFSFRPLIRPPGWNLARRQIVKCFKMKQNSMALFMAFILSAFQNALFILRTKWLFIFADNAIESLNGSCAICAQPETTAHQGKKELRVFLTGNLLKIPPALIFNVGQKRFALPATAGVPLGWRWLVSVFMPDILSEISSAEVYVRHKRAWRWSFHSASAWQNFRLALCSPLHNFAWRKAATKVADEPQFSVILVAQEISGPVNAIGRLFSFDSSLAQNTKGSV